MSEPKRHVWDDPANVKRLLVVFWTVCAFAFLFDFILERHSSFEHGEAPAAEGTPEHPSGHEAEGAHPPDTAALESAELFTGFYPIYGFVACVLLVVTAKGMRVVLKRDESYYGTSATYDTSGIAIDPGVPEGELFDPDVKRSEGGGHG